MTPNKALCPLIEKWQHELWGWDEKQQKYRCFPEYATSAKYCRRCQIESWLHSSGLGKLIEAGKALRHPAGRNTVADMRAWDAQVRQFEEASRGK